MLAHDNLWYFGMVKEVNNEEKDVVSFMHPNGPSPSFFWPEREDVCAIPILHVLMNVEPSITSTGRTYKFTQEVTENINTIRKCKLIEEPPKDNFYISDVVW